MTSSLRNQLNGRRISGRPIGGCRIGGCRIGGCRIGGLHVAAHGGAEYRVIARRGAILSMELVLVLPIFLLLVFSIVEFSMLMSARTRISDTARHTARLLSISGIQPAEVESVVHHLLGPRLSAGCQINLQTDNSFPGGGIVTVELTVPMRNAAPDLLWMIGYSVRDRLLRADATMVLERPFTTTVNSSENNWNYPDAGM